MKVLRFFAPVLCLLWLGQVCLAVDIEEEEGVLVLKSANFDQALEQYPNILVEFCEWGKGGGGGGGVPRQAFRGFEGKAPAALGDPAYPGRGLRRRLSAGLSLPTWSDSRPPSAATGFALILACHSLPRRRRSV